MAQVAPLITEAASQAHAALRAMGPKGIPRNKIFNRALADFDTAVKRGAGDIALTRAAIRGLYIAMPAPVCQAMPAEAIRAYDSVLAAERDSSTVTDARAIPEQLEGISVWQGDMSRLRADAVVNPGNNALLGCFLPAHKCLDNILHGASGPRLRIACADMLASLGLEEDSNGQCRVTPAFELPANYVFHTVGPCLLSPRRFEPPRAPTPQDRAELRSCYESCLSAAIERGCSSIAFCCISTGIFGYPAEEAAQIAIATVQEHRARTLAAGDAFPKVIFNVFKDEDLEIYTRLLTGGDAPAAAADEAPAAGDAAASE